VLLNSPEKILSLGRRRGPHWHEVAGRPASELHVGVDTAAVRTVVEVEIRLVAKVEVRAVTVASRHVDKTIDGAQRVHQPKVAHSVRAATDTASW
jgi:hypothetical protein